MPYISLVVIACMLTWKEVYVSDWSCVLFYLQFISDLLTNSQRSRTSVRMTQTLFIVCALGRIQSLVKSVQNFTFKKAQLHPISHTEFTRTSNAICEQHVGSEYLVWLSMLTLKYWACNHVSYVSVIWNGELACAHLWISMQLAKSVNLCVCVCVCVCALHIVWATYSEGSFNYSGKFCIILDSFFTTHTLRCSLTLSDCTFEYVTEERQKAEVTPHDHILVQDPYLKNMTTLLKSVLMNYSISLTSHPQKKRSTMRDAPGSKWYSPQSIWLFNNK